MTNSLKYGIMQGNNIPTKFIVKEILRKEIIKLKKIRRLFQYLKPYKFTLLIIFFCFIAQQICSLYLPTLMSNIVDIGIRRNGIENASPDAISVRAHDILISFMSEDEKLFMDKSYWLVGADDIKSMIYEENQSRATFKINSLKEKYPLLNYENIYVLKDVSYLDRNKLDECFASASLRFFNYINVKNELTSNEYVSEYDNNEKVFNFDFLRFYENIPDFKKLTSYDLLKLDNKSVEKVNPYQIAFYLDRQIYTELKTDIVKMQRNYIIKIGIIMLIVTLVSILFTVSENLVSSKMSAGISVNLRNDVFERVSMFSEHEFNKISASSLITRTTNDISQMKSVILMGIESVVPPIMLTGGLIMALKKSTSMSWIMLIGAGISALVIIVGFAVIFPKARLMQKLLDKFNLIITERLNGIMVINSFGNSEKEHQRFDECNRDLSNIASFVNKTIMYIAPFLTVVMNLFGILIIWLGAHQISEAKMQIGDLMAFIQYSAMIIGSFLILVMLFSYLPHAFISADRVFEVLDMKTSIKDPSNPLYFSDNFKGELIFKNVSFSYGENENFALKDISFNAKCGQFVSIIGPTGAGKTTLVSLIPRFYDVSLGEISIDGINIKDVNQFHLREKISYVPQESVLFSGSMEYNLRYGKSEVDENILKLCSDISGVSDMSEDGALDRKVSQRGKNFSGGQRQKICIARGLIKNTPIYIFDDCFSALDLNTEATIREKILDFAKNSLVILVSQRIGSVIASDKIIVLESGKVVGQGTHQTLLSTCDTYREIAKSQIPGEVMQ